MFRACAFCCVTGIKVGGEERRPPVACLSAPGNRRACRYRLRTVYGLQRRRENHDHLPPLEPRLRLDLRLVREVIADTEKELQPKLLVGHLATTEAQGHF